MHLKKKYTMFHIAHTVIIPREYVSNREYVSASVLEHSTLHLCTFCTIICIMFTHICFYFDVQMRKMSSI